MVIGVEVDIKKRITSIDGLKGVMCVFIAFFIHWGVFWKSRNFLMVDYMGVLVEIYIAISGFMMAYNYKYRIREMKFDKYFLNRYLKLMPLYWITEICMYCIYIRGGIIEEYLCKDSIWTLLLEILGFYRVFLDIRNIANAPLWTVNVLLFCYIIYYVISYIAKDSKIKYVLLVSALLLLEVILLIDDGNLHMSSIFGKQMIRGFGAFAMGLLIYELYEKLRIHVGMIVALVGISILCVICIGLWNRNIELSVTMQTLGGVFLLTPVVIMSTIYIKPVRVVLSKKFFSFMGSISMSIYMWHWVVRNIVVNFYYYDGTGLVIYVIGTVVVAIFSHCFLEPKLRGFGDKVSLMLKLK